MSNSKRGYKSYINKKSLGEQLEDVPTTKEIITEAMWFIEWMKEDLDAYLTA